MSRILFSLLFSVVLTTSYAQVNFPDVSNFSKIVQDKVYTPDDLYDLINGAADSYLEYNFQRLEICEYKGENDQTVKVEVYQHKSLNCAFGIYANERQRDYQFITIGTEGYISGNALIFFKNKFYVKCQSDDTSAIKIVAQQIAQAIEGDAGFPEILSVLPEGTIAYTQAFAKRNFLGYSVLMDFCTAQYAPEITFFITKKYTSADASAVLQYLYDKSGATRLEYGNGFYKIKDEHAGTLYVQLFDNYLFGTINAKKKDAKALMMDCEEKISQK